MCKESKAKRAEQVLLRRRYRNVSNTLSAEAPKGKCPDYIGLSFSDRVAEGLENHFYDKIRGLDSVTVAEIEKVEAIDGRDIPDDIIHLELATEDFDRANEPDYFINHKWGVIKGSRIGDRVPSDIQNVLFGCSLTPIMNLVTFDDEVTIPNRGRMTSNVDVTVSYWEIEFQDDKHGVAYVETWLFKFREGEIHGVRKSVSMKEKFWAQATVDDQTASIKDRIKAATILSSITKRITSVNPEIRYRDRGERESR